VRDQVIFQEQPTSPHHNNIKDIIKGLITTGVGLFTDFLHFDKANLGFGPSALVRQP